MTAGVTVTVEVPAGRPDVPSWAAPQPPVPTPPPAGPEPHTSTVHPLPSPAAPPPGPTRTATATGVPSATMPPSLSLTGMDTGLLLVVAVAFLVAGVLALWRARSAANSPGETP